tara:strand:+ start:2006 stop:2512 length:507 start_codon:yes stop_codon:yes gene_type:complete
MINADVLYDEFVSMPMGAVDGCRALAEEHEISIQDAYGLIVLGRDRFRKVRNLLLSTINQAECAERIAQHFLANPHQVQCLTEAQRGDLHARLQQGLVLYGELQPVRICLTSLLTPYGCNDDAPHREILIDELKSPTLDAWHHLDPVLVQALLASLGENEQFSTGDTL